MVTVSKHYKKRYRDRVAKTSRIEYFAEKAFYEGTNLKTSKDSRIRKIIQNEEEYRDDKYHHYQYIAHSGFLHIFCNNCAITVYPYKEKWDDSLSHNPK